MRMQARLVVLGLLWHLVDVSAIEENAWNQNEVLGEEPAPSVETLEVRF